MKSGYVALVGRPNVGKSTLLNRILGEKVAIVSDKPQTTRISILGIKTTPQGQIIFIDNPGIHKPLHKLNKRMMNFVYSAFETADLVCLLIDGSLKFGSGDAFVIETMKKISTPVFLLINKVDIVKKEKILLLIDKYKDLYPFKEIIPISALRGTQVDVLEDLIFQHLPEAEKPYDEEELTNQTERFYFAEIIREKLLARVEKELPFVTAVYIEDIEERPLSERKSKAAREAMEAKKKRSVSKKSPDLDTGAEKAEQQPIEEQSEGEGEGKIIFCKYIKASIFVEKDNHRKIVIGRHGSLIKDIGTAARKELEDYLEMPVFLDLQVKVKKNWRDSADVLDLIEGQE